jgi:putative membrane protein
MTTTLQTTPQQREEARTPLWIILAIIAVSAVASAFICWLVYFHHPVDTAGAHLTSLPLVNAGLNALCTVYLLIGFSFIRRRRVAAHRSSMLIAFLFSSIFLITYLLNYALHGDTKFNRLSPWWPTYKYLLISHIALSTIALPLILITFFFSLTGRFPSHKKLARYTFPIWLYVSVTGVIVYLMQSAIH